ncbi:NO-inducible flavohemoprotein [Curvibacter sp. HBC28]|uniref:Flavohemoprotein n=2 Tax=Curvibacter microcysteis TaxID=3026419 RepID=A0ABT5MB62_9BURK|nr:NO-inducible flavohemoprotein [Curvibacter sp. HBC28]MDD0813793.1 NO-inducible flavohemoprotein [Curvibacter sp. HBC28]
MNPLRSTFMLNTVTRQLVKATAPVLKEHGVTLTRHFYARMFQHNPELREVFNQGHQRGGSQQEALAMAVAAYAEHIDHPEVLMPVLERVAAKHVSLGIRPEHYTIVGRHLLASISEVLGEGATPELIEAWAAAYGQLADLLMGLEQQGYHQAASQAGGWTGWRSFRVQTKRAESEEITSFELVPADGGQVPSYRPGQYVSVRLLVPELGYRQPRQYSLSDAPGRAHLRISVKREAADTDRPAGMVSNRLHDHVQAGDVIELAPPAGDFFLHTDRQTPVVLLSAGVGITPMMAMLAHLQATAPQRPLRFVHAARHAGVQAFAPQVRALTQAMANAQAWLVHEAQRPEPASAQPDALGRLDLQHLAAQDLLPPDADYYLCGPKGFMSAQIHALKDQGVAAERIHAEAFGTGGVAA